jgi:hypothetical protein
MVMTVPLFTLASERRFKPLSTVTHKSTAAGGVAVAVGGSADGMIVAASVATAVAAKGSGVAVNCGES